MAAFLSKLKADDIKTHNKIKRLFDNPYLDVIKEKAQIEKETKQQQFKAQTGVMGLATAQGE